METSRQPSAPEESFHRKKEGPLGLEWSGRRCLLSPGVPFSPRCCCDAANTGQQAGLFMIIPPSHVSSTEPNMLPQNGLP